MKKQGSGPHNEHQATNIINPGYVCDISCMCRLLFLPWSMTTTLIKSKEDISETGL